MHGLQTIKFSVSAIHLHIEYQQIKISQTAVGQRTFHKVYYLLGTVRYIQNAFYCSSHLTANNKHIKPDGRFRDLYWCLLSKHHTVTESCRKHQRPASD